jgi:hypothetical protein
MMRGSKWRPRLGDGGGLSVKTHTEQQLAVA